MRRIIFLSLCLFSIQTALCQELIPEIIISAGDYFKGPNGSLSWTMGESVIETYTSTNGILTQGFQQPFTTVSGIKELKYSNIGIIVYPNPVSDFLNVRFIATEKIDLIIELIDLNGKVLLNEKVVTDQFITQINFKYVKPGSYFLRLRKTTGELIESYKILKVIY